MGISTRSSVIAVGVAALAFFPVGVVAAPVIIDDFNASSSISQNGVGTVSGRTLGLMIGGERDAILQVTEDPGGAGDVNEAEFSVNNAGLGRGNYINDAGIKSNLTLQYDGTGDAAPEILDASGLGGLDVTDGGLNDGIAIQIAFSDLPVTTVILLYTDAANWSQATIDSPGLIFSEETFFVAFDDFTIMSGAGGDPTNMGALTFNFAGLPGLDFRFAFLAAIEQIPEPRGLGLAAMAAAMVGLAAAGSRRRRTRATAPGA